MRVTYSLRDAHPSLQSPSSTTLWARTTSRRMERIRMGLCATWLTGSSKSVSSSCLTSKLWTRSFRPKLVPTIFALTRSKLIRLCTATCRRSCFHFRSRSTSSVPTLSAGRWTTNLRTTAPELTFRMRLRFYKTLQSNDSHSSASKPLVSSKDSKRASLTR